MLRKISVDSMKIEGICTLGYHNKVLIFLFVCFRWDLYFKDYKRKQVKW